MSKTRPAYRFFVVALTIGVFVLSATAETLRLKDGSIIKGSIVAFKDGRFTVAVGEGARRREMTFFAIEVESIVFDTSGSATNRNASYTPNTEKPPVKVVTSDPVTNNTTSISNKPLIKAPVATPTSGGSSSVKPVSWTVNVLADNTANGWTNTGWVVKKGQRVHITGDGKISLGSGRSSTASGSPDLVDNNKLLKNVPTGALIAVIGDDNNDFIYIGAEREFTATRDGALFLGINEGQLDDNSGSFNVKVEIAPQPSN